MTLLAALALALALATLDALALLLLLLAAAALALEALVVVVVAIVVVVLLLLAKAALLLLLLPWPSGAGESTESLGRICTTETERSTECGGGVTAGLWVHGCGLAARWVARPHARQPSGQAVRQRRVQPATERGGRSRSGTHTHLEDRARVADGSSRSSSSRRLAIIASIGGCRGGLDGGIGLSASSTSLLSTGCSARGVRCRRASSGCLQERARAAWGCAPRKGRAPGKRITSCQHPQKPLALP